MKESGVITQWDGTGYGPRSRAHWNNRQVYWRTHPDEYKKPIRLDPSWDTDDNWIGGGGVHVRAWDSQEAWNEAKQGYEWLYPILDDNKDGKVSEAEHQAFQDYKRRHPDWNKFLRNKTSLDD